LADQIAGQKAARYRIINQQICEEYQMKKVMCAAVASAFMLATIGTNTASATVALPVVHTVGTSSAAGAAATGGFIGFVAFLVTYDLVRRTTCIGDPLMLGGPGFSEPMPATGNILPPQCKVAAYKSKRHRH
jgi:hypothetical protein